MTPNLTPSPTTNATPHLTPHLTPNLTTHELDSPPWLRVESTLMATARLVRTAFDVRLAPLDLNLTQASLLGYIAEFGPTTQTRLADHLAIGRAAIGSVIDQLEGRDLIERQPNPDRPSCVAHRHHRSGPRAGERDR